MLSTTVTFEGNLAEDPQVRYTPTGAQIVEFTVLVNRSRQNDAGQWVNEEPTRHACKAFRQLGTHTVDSLSTGDRALIVGTVVTDSWTDKGTGDKRTRPVVLVDAIGASLRYATAQPVRTRTGDTTNPDPTGS
jgi:single-strand DNA-binding protein